MRRIVRLSNWGCFFAQGTTSMWADWTYTSQDSCNPTQLSAEVSVIVPFPKPSFNVILLTNTPKTTTTHRCCLFATIHPSSYCNQDRMESQWCAFLCNCPPCRFCRSPRMRTPLSERRNSSYSALCWERKLRCWIEWLSDNPTSRELCWCEQQDS